jgi:hypothetical protein
MPNTDKKQIMPQCTKRITIIPSSYDFEIKEKLILVQIEKYVKGTIITPI